MINLSDYSGVATGNRQPNFRRDGSEIVPPFDPPPRGPGRTQDCYALPLLSPHPRKFLRCAPSLARHGNGHRPRHAIRHHRQEDWPEFIAFAQAFQPPGNRSAVGALPKAVPGARSHLCRDCGCTIRLTGVDRLQVTFAAVDGLDESVRDEPARGFDGAKAQGSAIGRIHWNLLRHA